MKYILGTFVVLTVLTLLFYYIVIGTVVTTISNTDTYINESKELIGEKFVIDKDTLIITNFRYVPTASYYLVGEKEFAVKFVEKNLIK